jgi:hypothetical protein
VKLGDKVAFDKYIEKASYGADKETTIEFFKLANLAFKEDNTYRVGVHGICCPWYGHKLESPKVGVLCGMRNIFTKVGSYWEGVPSPEKPFQVYLVATKMNGFYRVPKDWVKEAGGM